MYQNIGLIVAGLFLLALTALVARYFSLWFRGWVTRIRIGLPSLFFMSLRKVNPSEIVDVQIMAVQSGIPRISTDALEAHYLAGGNIKRVTLALIAANRASIELNWDTAAAIDLAGRDVLEAVRVSVNPIVIDCPDPSTGRDTLDGVAKDGIQLKVRVRVTVRTNLSRLIGGATESTVIARVGEGIVSAIGSCECYTEALSNPLLIARQVLAAGLDSQTAYELVSIDIADIDVGENIGARLQSDQAQADMRVARARAEERRAEAVATLQEMVALTQENRALVALAEAEVPIAMAQAYRSGNLRNKSAHKPLDVHRGSGFQVLRGA